VIGSKHIGVLSHDKAGDEDDLLIRADKTPNRFGVQAVGVVGENAAFGIDHILKGITEGAIKVLYVLEENIAADPKIAEVLTNLEILIVHSSTRNETTAKADIVLSSSTFAEKHGTIINFQGRVQMLRPAVAMIDHERALDGLAMSRWDKFAAQNDSWGKGIKRDARSSWRIIAAVASAIGGKMKYTSAEEVFKEMAERLPAFKGLTYAKIGTRGAQIKEIKSSTVKKN
jgi:NADH-quinone oxidoreductase subunit G